MKNNAMQQEVILMTNTTFSQRQWCEKIANSRAKALTQKEQLEEACWNGLLYELLPEIMLLTASGKRLFMWHSRQEASFLQLELSAFPVIMEKQRSINPGFFLSTILYN